MKTKQFYLLLTGIISLLMVWSCEKEEAEPYIHFADIQPDAVVEYNASTVERMIDTNVDINMLSVRSDANWCIGELVKTAQGIKLIVSAQENISSKERQAKVTVGVISSDAEVSMAVKQGAITFAFVNDQSNASVKWNVSSIEHFFETDAVFDKLSVKSNQGWCKAQLEQTPQGNKLKVNMEDNISLEDRKATISFYYSDTPLDVTFTVIQERIRIIYDYWGNGKSYVEYDIPGFEFQLKKVARTAVDELEIEYTITNRDYPYNIGATFYASGSEPAISDDTGRTYMTKMPYNGDYLATINGNAFGMYGQGVDCTFRPNAPVLGRVIVHNFTQTATSIWLTFVMSSNDLDMVRPVEFVNVPIEQERTEYNIVKEQ